MKACILNSDTKVVENIIILEEKDFQNFIPYKNNIELAPQHDGELGWIWSDFGWIKPDDADIDIEELSLIMRRRRDNLLIFNVDSLGPIRWQLMSQEQKDAWVQYRQDLLDVPQQEGFPENIIWPNIPSF